MHSHISYLYKTSISHTVICLRIYSASGNEVQEMRFVVKKMQKKLLTITKNSHLIYRNFS